MSNQLKCAESLSPLVCTRRQRFPFLASPSIESAISLCVCLKRLISLTPAETARAQCCSLGWQERPCCFHTAVPLRAFFTLQLLLSARIKLNKSFPPEISRKSKWWWLLSFAALLGMHCWQTASLGNFFFISCPSVLGGFDAFFNLEYRRGESW